jgi:hypothetical protein
MVTDGPLNLNGSTPFSKADDKSKTFGRTAMRVAGVRNMPHKVANAKVDQW